jgi:hypothetical protein
MTQGHSEASALLKAGVAISAESKLQTQTLPDFTLFENGPKGAASLNMLDVQCINTIRTLAMDTVQQANSGPGR